MNRSRNRHRNVLAALALFILGTAIFTSRLAGQDDVWQVNRADYGWRDQRTDVTRKL